MSNQINNLCVHACKKLDILEPIKSCIFSIKTYHVNILLSIKYKKRDRHDNENIVEQVVVYRF